MLNQIESSLSKLVLEFR